MFMACIALIWPQESSDELLWFSNCDLLWNKECGSSKHLPLVGGFSSVKELRYCYVYPLRQNHDPAHYCSVVPVSAFPPFLD